MKKNFEAPEVEVVNFTTEDIITASSAGNDAVVERLLPDRYGDQP